MIKISKNRRNIRKKGRNVGIKTFFGINRFVVFVVILIIIIVVCIGINEYRRAKDIELFAKQQQEIEAYSQKIFSEMENNISKTNQSILETDEIIKISAVGDILCGESMIEDAYNSDLETYDFSHMFRNVLEYTNKTDITIGTMETSFTTGKYTSENAPKEFAQAIKKAGINLVTISHNHSLDCGLEGLKDTKQYLEEIGFSVVGDKLKSNDKAVVIREVKNAKIAFLTYTYGVNNQSIKTKEELSAINIYSKKQVKSDMKYAKEEGAEYICVLIHWGDVITDIVNQKQEEMADFLVSEGADVIIGAHPSVVQPMEVRKNKEGKNVFIAYSVGTYISNLADESSKVELVLNIELRKSGKDGKIYLNKVDYTPIYVLDNGYEAENRYELIDMKKVAKNYAKGDIQNISKDTYNQLLKGLEKLDELLVQ